MPGGAARALIVDPAVGGDLSRRVAAAGLATDVVADARSALGRMEQGAFDVVVVDLAAPGSTELVAAHAARFPDVPLVAVAAPGAGPGEADVLRHGAAEWIERSNDSAELGAALERALVRARSAGEVLPPAEVPGSKILGESPAIQRVRELVARAAPGNATVLLRGETGTGKELVARLLHDAGSRSNGPFVKTHVAALPDALVESELFGYEKGAFTGATAKKPGRVELAQAGTLFLDEIGEISPAVQAKLLRLVQDREYERLGGTRSHSADVRFVAATHRDLEHMVEQGSFRQDLFYRLNVVSIWLPPLRARRSDIPIIARAYAASVASANQREVELDESALALLRSQRWPGNVRQLLNLVERVIVLATGPVVGAEDVRRELEEQVSFATQSTAASSGGAPVPGLLTSMSQGAPSSVRPLREEIRRAEKYALEKALASAKGNRSQAARLLGVSRRTLYTKLEEHGLA